MVPLPDAEGPSIAMTGASLMRDLPEFVEEARERLRHAARIVDAHRHAAERGERQAHRHAVVVVGFYRHLGLDRGRRKYFQEIAAFLDLRAELPQLRGHGGDAVGLLDAPARDV